jgi:nucleoid DNA-binding protein
MVDRQTFIRALQERLPQWFTTDEEAELAVEAIFSVIPGGLKKGDTVEIQGVGEFRTEPEAGRKRIVFAADRRLMDTVNG